MGEAPAVDRGARVTIALLLAVGGLLALSLGTSTLAEGRFAVAGDGHYVFATARSLAYDGDLDLTNQLRVMGDRWGLGRDPAADGFRFPPREIGPALVMVPGLWLHHLLGASPRLEPTFAVAPIAMLLGPLFVLLARLLDALDQLGGDRLGPRERTGLALAATLGGVVPFYAIGHAAYAHALDALCCTGLVLALVRAREPVAQGIWLAAALLCRLQNVLWLAWLLVGPRPGGGDPDERAGGRAPDRLLELAVITGLGAVGLAPQIITALRHPGSSRGPIRWGLDFFDLDGLGRDLLEVVAGTHGWWTWTPLALLGVLGLALLARPGPRPEVAARARAALLATPEEAQVRSDSFHTNQALYLSLLGTAVVSGGVSLVLWIVGDDPDRYEEFHSLTGM